MTRTNYETLWELCGRLPAQYVDQSRARLSNAVEGMSFDEADRRLDLRLAQHGLLDHLGGGMTDRCEHPDHEDGVSCLERAVGCSGSCRCCMGYSRG